MLNSPLEMVPVRAAGPSIRLIPPATCELPFSGFGDHLSLIDASASLAPAPVVSAAQVTAASVFSWIWNFPPSTELSLVQPDSVPLIWMFCTAGVSVKPGESLILTFSTLQVVVLAVADALAAKENA